MRRLLPSILSVALLCVACGASSTTVDFTAGRNPRPIAYRASNAERRQQDAATARPLYDAARAQSLWAATVAWNTEVERAAASARLRHRASVPARSHTTPPLPSVRPAAASGSVNWDAIAQCESGGDWQANTGNGFEGGLQFTLSTWHAYGGVGHAYDASREQQIVVAERVLAGQGIGAWPVCGRRG